MTTAYRSKLYLDKQGWTAAVVEHRAGNYRTDLYGVGDVLAFHPEHGILMVQAYNYYDRGKHGRLMADQPIIKLWLASGGKFAHHVWHRPSKKLRKWTVEVRGITLQT